MDPKGAFIALRTRYPQLVAGEVTEIISEDAQGMHSCTLKWREKEFTGDPCKTRKLALRQCWQGVFDYAKEVVTEAGYLVDDNKFGDQEDYTVELTFHKVADQMYVHLPDDASSAVSTNSRRGLAGLIAMLAKQSTMKHDPDYIHTLNKIIKDREGGINKIKLVKKPDITRVV